MVNYKTYMKLKKQKLVGVETPLTYCIFIEKFTRTGLFTTSDCDKDDKRNQHR